MQTDILIESLKKADQTIIVVRPKEGALLTLQHLLQYLEKEKGNLYQMLLKHGGILFRGFDINDKEEFLKVKEICAGASNFDYVDGNSPRTKLSDNVYTSTEYPKEYRISLHNEMSYSNKWPGLIFFFCKTPAEEGGETPVLDCRSILKTLDQDMVKAFEEYGVKYTRCLNGAVGAGKSWMDTFETHDKSVVEDYCKANDIQFKWDGDFLCLSQLGAGVEVHPLTKEKVWFNQANQFHPSNLPEDIYRALKMMYSKNKHKYPQYAYFGNDEEIPEQYLSEITEQHFEQAFMFKWEKGDVLMLDNMLMAHGRMPFKGDRKIYVSMC
ncbi:TauD/TfdA family dioxygenase [Pedobacter alluvionis]|uniref:TfdA family taurine catabolism dioxygenase TauD n=1 Tax=Pedobacter alluvionis TaxID=475253 RepID=A0A497XTI3_9SPHI|nr:TauD/TfdA family dioxygenase [Pedobacter alluvionis]RLJ72740.1 TfdA family taurine catabolism dioxygenase TauD [Pedobacter alluvionis]TFB29420.1 hypothetical protein E3V97_20495 [Pedobacter alluvionis]